MADIDLKPCPFCGGDVRFDEAYSYFRDTVIYCDSCDMVFTLDDCEATNSEIVEAWNRRAKHETCQIEGQMTMWEDKTHDDD